PISPISPSPVPSRTPPTSHPRSCCSKPPDPARLPPESFDMPHLHNAPRFDDLDRLPLGEIAVLPPNLLIVLYETALAETAGVKRLRDRLEAGIAQRYGAAADAERAAQ